MKIIYLLFTTMLMCNAFRATAQNVAINNEGTPPDPSAMLDVSSSLKGILVPRMSTAQIMAINNPANGLLVFDSAKKQLIVNMGSALAPDWQNIVFKSGWSLTGNSNTDTAVNFIGTTDDNPFLVKVNNQVAGMLDNSNNVFWGVGAGKINPGLSNIALGYNAFANGGGVNQIAIGENALSQNISGTSNVSIGSFTLQNHISGNSNTAIGHAAMYSDTTGLNNTAIGFMSLYSNMSGFNNTAVGINALYANTAGNYNTGAGSGALQRNLSGNENNALGRRALYNNSTGSSNVALGNWALFSNTSRSNLVAVGDSALYNNGIGVSLPVHATGNTAAGSKALLKNTLGYANTALGFAALKSNTIGYFNCAIGHNALGTNINGWENTALGINAGANFTSNKYCTFIGDNADAAEASLQNSTAIGYNAVVNDDNKIRFGNSAVTVIEGATSFTVSDGRFKQDVKDNVPGLDFITSLKPVTYRYKSYELDKFLFQKNTKLFTSLKQSDYSQSEEMVHMGFIAQDVEELIKQKKYQLSIVKTPATANDNYSLAYSELIAPLVRAVQEQQQQIELLKKDNADIKDALQKLLTTPKNK